MYGPHANSGRGAANTATKEYGAECVRILGLLAGRESSLYLSDQDRRFIQDMKGKVQVCGSGFMATITQVRWLRDLKDRLIDRG